MLSAMPQIKTSELIGPALDWAVACIEYPNDTEVKQPHLAQRSSYGFSRRWEEGGPIIEREGIETFCNLSHAQAMRFKDAHSDWRACLNRGRSTHWYGPTPLIAAMRCYVATKCGGVVEIPKEILNVD